MGVGIQGVKADVIVAAMLGDTKDDQEDSNECELQMIISTPFFCTRRGVCG